MSTVIAYNSALTNMAPPRARLVSAQQTAATPVTDDVQLSGGKAAEEKPEDKPGVSLGTQIAAGVGLALVLTGAVAGFTGSIPAMGAPTAITQVQTRDVKAVGDDAAALMKDVASPSLTDNLTANQVRNRYGNEVDDVLGQAKTFDQLNAHLGEVGQKLQAYADKFPEGGSLVENGAQIGIEKADGKVTVTVQNADASVQEAVISRHGITVKERDAQGTTTTREETARQVKVNADGVTMTVNKMTGTFEMATQEGPRTQIKVTVSGASITEQRRETISGYAGMISINTTTKYDVPETSVMVYPRVVVTETKTTVSDDGFGAKSTTSTRTEVYDNGSSKTFQKGPDGKEMILESDGPAILIAGR